MHGYADKFLKIIFCLKKEIYLAGVQRAQPFVQVEGAAPPSEMLGTDTSYWVLSVDKSSHSGEFENSFTRGEGGKTETK